jgi:hypothetical protein
VARLQADIWGDDSKDEVFLHTENYAIWAIFFFFFLDSGGAFGLKELRNDTMKEVI